MALRSGYKGFKKLLGLKIIRPGILTVDDDVLSKTFFTRSEQAVLGAKNLVKNTATSGSKNNVTWVVNNDGTITVNTGTGGASTNTDIEINTTQYFKKGSYILSGCPSGGSEITYFLRVSRGFDVSANDTGKGAMLNLAADGLQPIYLKVEIRQGVELTNAVFKPMIRLATDPDSTYAPHAMSNKELTDEVETLKGSVSDQKTAINAIITAATDAADFAAFQTAMGAITPVTRSLNIQVPETREASEPEPTTKKSTKKSTAKAD